MKENKKLIIILGIVAVIATLFIVMSIMASKENEKKLEKFNEYFSQTENKLIYLARDTCYYCQKLSPAKKTLLDDTNIDYYYVDTDKINSSTLSLILSKLGIAESNFGTPTLAVVNNGEVLNVQSGVFSAETDNVKELKEYLEKYSIIEKSE